MTMGYNLQPNAPTVNLNALGLVKDSLRLYFDAGLRASFPGTGKTWFDLSGNGTHATFYASGGSTYTDNHATEPFFENNNGQPRSFYFDGVDDFARFNPFSLSTNQTISVWLKTTTTKGTAGIFSHCNGGPVYTAYELASGTPRYQYYSGGWLSWSGPSTVNNGNWRNIVWAKSGTNMVLYVDGVSVASTTLSANVGGTVASIGCNWGPCNPDSYGAGSSSYGSCFEGNIGALMVHEKQLSATEVTQNYNYLKNRFK